MRRALYTFSSSLRTYTVVTGRGETCANVTLHSLHRHVMLSGVVDHLLSACATAQYGQQTMHPTARGCVLNMRLIKATPYVLCKVYINGCSINHDHTCRIQRLQQSSYHVFQEMWTPQHDQENGQPGAGRNYHDVQAVALLWLGLGAVWNWWTGLLDWNTGLKLLEWPKLL